MESFKDLAGWHAYSAFVGLQEEQIRMEGRFFLWTELTLSMRTRQGPYRNRWRKPMKVLPIQNDKRKVKHSQRESTWYKINFRSPIVRLTYPFGAWASLGLAKGLSFVTLFWLSAKASDGSGVAFKRDLFHRCRSVARSLSPRYAGRTRFKLEGLTVARIWKMP